MQVTDPLLIAREGAKYLQVSLPTFYRRIADGTLPKPIKMGSLSRWSQSEIWRQSNTPKPSAMLVHPLQ